MLIKSQESLKTEKQNKSTLDISVVIPIYNEAENISVLDHEIKTVLNKLKKSYEIIYINDGSKDDSLKELNKLANIKIIELARNYGQSTALDAGFREAKGNIIITLDSDLQNDPNDIPKMIEKLEWDNLDVVAGWRKKRKDPLGIRILTKTGRMFRKFIIKDDVHDTGCTLRVYRKEAAKSLDLQGEMHRYILGLLRWKGFKIGEIEVNHRERLHGKTKYGYSKAIRGFIDLIYISFIQKYSQRPLHMFGYMSLISFLVSFLSAILTIYQRIFLGLGLNRNGWFFLAIFFGLAGIMFFSFGIIMDLMLRVYLNTSKYDKRYYTREIIVK